MIIIKKVGGYLRLSDEDRFKLKETDDSESIRNQRDLLVEFVGNNPEWEIFDIYVDDDVSGASNNRPAFKQLLKDCEEGKIDIVICKSQSRFTRTMEEVESILHNKFIEWGIRFIGIVDMEFIISSLEAFKKASGDVYFSNNVNDVLTVTLEKIFKYCGNTIRSSPCNLFT